MSDRRDETVEGTKDACTQYFFFPSGATLSRELQWPTRNFPLWFEDRPPPARSERPISACSRLVSRGKSIGVFGQRTKHIHPGRVCFLLCFFVRNSSEPSVPPFFLLWLRSFSPFAEGNEMPSASFARAVSLRIALGAEQTENEDSLFKGALFGTLREWPHTPNMFNRNKVRK